MGLLTRGVNAASPLTAATLPGIVAGWRQQFTLDGSDRVTQWADESANADHLTPPGTAPATKRYHFGGYRGVFTNPALTVSTEHTISRPWEIWCVVECNALTAAQHLIQSTDGSHTRVTVNSSGAVIMRINSVNKTVAPTSTITTGNTMANVYVIRVASDASGNLECEVNGTVHSEGQSSTDDIQIGGVCRTAGAQNAYLGAVYIYDDILSTKEQGYLRRELADFRRGTVALIGLSNTNDIADGCNAIGWPHTYHAATGYNSQDLKDWFDNIGNTGVVPWLTFINEASRSASGGHPHIEKILFHVGISPSNVGESLATRQTWVTDVLAEARAQLVTAGHASNLPAYFSPLANYTSDVSCTIVSSGAYDECVELTDWAPGALTNSFAGPVLPVIDLTRADDGDPTSPCHVEEYWKKDEGLMMQGFFK